MTNTNDCTLMRLNQVTTPSVSHPIHPLYGEPWDHVALIHFDTNVIVNPYRKVMEIYRLADVGL